MNKKIMILILVTINTTVQKAELGNIFHTCINMDIFNINQRKDFIYLKQVLKLNPIGEGDFGKVHNMFLSKTKSSISVRTKTVSESTSMNALDELTFIQNFVKRFKLINRIINREIFLKKEKIISFRGDLDKVL